MADTRRIGRATTLPVMYEAGQASRESPFQREVAHRGYLPNLRPLLTPWRRSPRWGDQPAERVLPLLSEAEPPKPSISAPQLAHLIVSKKAQASKPSTGPWGMVFTMCSATLGAGALSLPYAISQMGLVLGIALLVVTAAATYHSISLLTAAMDATRLFSYEELTVHAFGRPMGVLVEVSIVAFCFGTCVAYTVAAGDILEPVLRMRALKDAVAGSPIGPLFLSKRRVLCVLWGIVMLPLSLAENLSAFEASSTFGVVSLIYLVLSVAVHSVYECAAAPELTVEQVQALHLGPASLSSLAILIFAFTCQVNVPSMYAELEQRTPETMRLISRRSSMLCLICYALIGAAGYANFPQNVHANVLSNYKLDEVHSRLMAPSYCAILLTVLMAYPLNIFPCRYTVDVILQRFIAFWRGEIPPASPPSTRYADDANLVYSTMSAKRRVVLTIVIAGLSLLIALFVPGINIVFQLLGGTASAFVCFILPAAFAWHYNLPEVRSIGGKASCASLFLVGITISILSTAVTISEML